MTPTQTQTELIAAYREAAARCFTAFRFGGYQGFMDASREHDEMARLAKLLALNETEKGQER